MPRQSSRNGALGKREMILRAATRVFARNGYFNSKVADIARAADVADGTVYLYFKSKEEILHSIFDQNMADAIASGRKLIEKVRDPREKLRRIAKLHLERLGADRDLAVVFQVELRGSTKFMRESCAKLLRKVNGPARSARACMRKSLRKFCSARSMKWPRTGSSRNAITSWNQ